MAHKPLAQHAPLDLSKWRNVPLILLVAGGLLSLLGWVVAPKEFAFSWLLAFMFTLSLCLGALFLVLAHHLFDAGWSVPPRRFLEHIASTVWPWIPIFFIPIALLATKIYPWMTADPHADHAVHAKGQLFTTAGFYTVAVVNFLVWWVLSRGLRAWSIAQDKTGDAKCTFKMRGYAYWGIFAFSVTMTFAVIMW